MTIGATMRISTVPRSHDLSQLADHQMRKWALGMEVQERIEEQKAALSLHQLIHPYLAISREAGVDGSEIAESVAAKCGWKILDRDLLGYMAANYQWSPVELEIVDERTASWFHEPFGSGSTNGPYLKLSTFIVCARWCCLPPNMKAPSS
jgi:hypothetical protein